MSKINTKLGLKPASKRRMMNLPADRSERLDLLAARCPECEHAWHIQHVIHGVLLRLCGWCSRVTEVQA
jgi:hypothetical protein